MPSPFGWHSDNEIWTCEKEYQLARVRKVKLPAQELPDALAIGLMVHAARNWWFSSGFPRDNIEANALAAFQKEAERSSFPVSRKAELVALKTFVQYVEHWGVRPLPSVLKTEYEIGPANILPGSPHVRTATLDDISYYVELGGALGIGEAKTTNWKVGAVVSYYKQHGQLLLQKALFDIVSAAGGETGLFRGLKAAGVVLDVIRKPWDGQCEFAREPIVFEEAAIQLFLEEYGRRLDRKAEIGWDTDARREGFGQGCQKFIAGERVTTCKYRDLCMFGRGASHNYLVGDDYMSSWKPQYEGQKGPWE